MIKNIFLVVLLCITIIVNIVAQGSCSSPDGAYNFTATTPPDYNWLETNGYCMNGIATTGWVTMCWTFTSTASDVSSGILYSTNCNSSTVNSPKYYDASCAQIGSAYSIAGLTIGAQYVFCLRMRANGGPSCNGFNRVCPYWMDITPLPIELLYFECENQVIYWSTASEINNDYFLIEKSNDVETWLSVAKISGAGTTSTDRIYGYKVGCISAYFRLKQVDIDGGFSYSNITYCGCKIISPEKRIIKYNILGQEIR